MLIHVVNSETTELVRILFRSMMCITTVSSQRVQGKNNLNLIFIRRWPHYWYL